MPAYRYDDPVRPDPDQWRYAIVAVAAWALVLLAFFLM